jgi:hypothetical protein
MARARRRSTRTRPRHSDRVVRTQHAYQEQHWLLTDLAEEVFNLEIGLIERLLLVQTPVQRRKLLQQLGVCSRLNDHLHNRILANDLESRLSPPRSTEVQTESDSQSSSEEPAESHIFFKIEDSEARRSD